MHLRSEIDIQSGSYTVYVMICTMGKLPEISYLSYLTQHNTLENDKFLTAWVAFMEHGCVLKYGLLNSVRKLFRRATLVPLHTLEMYRV